MAKLPVMRRRDGLEGVAPVRADGMTILPGGSPPELLTIAIEVGVAQLPVVRFNVAAI
jgi:hypothetical protein